MTRASLRLAAVFFLGGLRWRMRDNGKHAVVNIAYAPGPRDPRHNDNDGRRRDHAPAATNAWSPTEFRSRL